MEKKEVVLNAFNALRLKGLVSSQQDFANLLGVNRISVSKALNGDERYLTKSFMEKVQNLTKDNLGAVPTEWVKEFPSLDAPNPTIFSKDTVPVIPTEAVAGTLGEFAESISLYQCERIISPVKGADYAIKVNGESMSPEYPSGSLALVKRIDPSVFVPYGNTLVLDTANGAVIKNVFPTDDDAVVECRSINPSFPPFKVRMADVFGWYRVLMCISTK